MADYESLARQLDERAGVPDKKRYRRSLEQTSHLLRVLAHREFPDDEARPFTTELETALLESDWRLVRSIHASLVKHLESEHDLVLPGHYQNQWMAIGMAAFGLPIGAAMSAALDSAAYIGIGLPIGLAIGSGLGARKDQQARAEGRVLEITAEPE